MLMTEIILMDKQKTCYILEGGLTSIFSFPDHGTAIPEIENVVQQIKKIVQSTMLQAI